MRAYRPFQSAAEVTRFLCIAHIATYDTMTLPLQFIFCVSIRWAFILGLENNDGRWVRLKKKKKVPVHVIELSFIDRFIVSAFDVHSMIFSAFVLSLSFFLCLHSGWLSHQFFDEFKRIYCTWLHIWLSTWVYCSFSVIHLLPLIYSWHARKSRNSFRFSSIHFYRMHIFRPLILWCTVIQSKLKNWLKAHTHLNILSEKSNRGVSRLLNTCRRRKKTHTT